MATIKPPSDPEKDPKVKAVFDDIRATRGADFINNVWRYGADPDLPGGYLGRGESSRSDALGAGR
ncbi:MAG: hypothetical protein R3D78_05855 [Paracoccaceae bacterium]